MSNEVLTWEITPSEKRRQVRNFILKTWLIFVVLAILSFTNFFDWTLREGIKPVLFTVIHAAIGVVVSI